MPEKSHSVTIGTVFLYFSLNVVQQFTVFCMNTDTWKLKFLDIVPDKLNFPSYTCKWWKHLLSNILNLGLDRDYFPLCLSLSESLRCYFSVHAVHLWMENILWYTTLNFNIVRFVFMEILQYDIAELFRFDPLARDKIHVVISFRELILHCSIFFTRFPVLYYN